MNNVFMVILAIIISLVLGITAGLLTALTMPNEWFGSCFEGACGYGAALFGILLGLLFALIGFFSWLYIWFNKKSNSEDIKHDYSKKTPIIAILWIILAALNISAFFINLGFNTHVYIIALSSILFIIFSAILAYHSKLNPLIVFILFIPYIGFWILFIILVTKARWHLSKPKQNTTDEEY